MHSRLVLAVVTVVVACTRHSAPRMHIHNVMFKPGDDRSHRNPIMFAEKASWPMSIRNCQSVSTK